MNAREKHQGDESGWCALCGEITRTKNCSDKAGNPEIWVCRSCWKPSFLVDLVEAKNRIRELESIFATWNDWFKGGPYRIEEDQIGNRQTGPT